MHGSAIEQTHEVNRSAAAERMHRHRQRRKTGLRCVTVELRATEIDALISKGLLASGTRNDPQSVLQALYAHLDKTLGA
jgi:hypothetical protein